MRRDYLPPGTLLVEDFGQVVANYSSNSFSVEVLLRIMELDLCYTVKVPIEDFAQFRRGNLFKDQQPHDFREGSVFDVAIDASTCRSIFTDDGHVVQGIGQLENESVVVKIKALEIFRTYFALTPVWAHSFMHSPLSKKDLRFFGLLSHQNDKSQYLYVNRNVPVELMGLMPHLFFDRVAEKSKYAKSSLAIANSLLAQFVTTDKRQDIKAYLSCPLPFDEGKVNVRCLATKEVGELRITSILTTSIPERYDVDSTEIILEGTEVNLEARDVDSVVERLNNDDTKLTKSKHNSKKRSTRSITEPASKTIFSFDSQPCIIKEQSETSQSHSPRVIEKPARETGAGGPSPNNKDDDIAAPKFDTNLMVKTSLEPLTLEFKELLLTRNFTLNVIAINETGDTSFSSVPYKVESELDVSRWCKYPSHKNDWVARPIQFHEYRSKDGGCIYTIDIARKNGDEHFKFYILIGPSMPDEMKRYTLKFVENTNGRLSGHLDVFKNVGYEAIGVNHNTSPQKLVERCLLKLDPAK